MRLSFLLLLALGLLLGPTACHSPRYFTENGDYDEAIDLCVRKIRGKSRKKTEFVQGLETAFRKAQARDLALAERLLDQNRPENWEQINNIHRQIRARQAKIAPLLPLRSKDGYRAKFEFVEIDKLENQSREKAAEHLYTRALELLERADRGDKAAAREAHSTLLDLEHRYFRQYRDKDRQLQRALDLGTSYVLFEVKNRSTQILPRNFADQLLSLGKYDLDSQWKAFYFERQAGVAYDYEAVFNVRQIDISPERVQERHYVDEKDIQDGWDYVLDSRGNVLKDSLGNDVKKPRMLRLRAQVIEVYQTKAARLAGVLEIYAGNSATPIDREDMAAEVLFENYASTFSGDARALSEESRRRIGNRPLPFPTNEDMLLQAAERLKPRVREELRRNRAIF